MDERRNELRKEHEKLYDETIRLEDILDNETFEDETRRRKLASELDIVDDKATDTANKLDEIYDYRESLWDASFYLKEQKKHWKLCREIDPPQLDVQHLIQRLDFFLALPYNKDTKKGTEELKNGLGKCRIILWVTVGECCSFYYEKYSNGQGKQTRCRNYERNFIYVL